jgi:hypothetical protein
MWLDRIGSEPYAVPNRLGCHGCLDLRTGLFPRLDARRARMPAPASVCGPSADDCSDRPASIAQLVLIYSRHCSEIVSSYNNYL